MSRKVLRADGFFGIPSIPVNSCIFGSTGIWEFNGKNRSLRCTYTPCKNRFYTNYFITMCGFFFFLKKNCKSVK